MTHIHNRAIGLDQPGEHHRQADPARQSRSAPPPPLPGPASHPFTRKIQAFIDAGKSRGAAIRAAAAQDPNGHASWLKAVNHG